MSEMLDRIYCGFGRHDDVPILFEDGEPWKVYCRRCERFAYDFKAIDAWRNRGDDEIRAKMRKAISEGARLVATKGNPPEGKET